MNKIINIILSGLLWRKYKFFILSLIVLIAFIFVVGQVHQDYLRYNELQDSPTNIGLSFAIKWLIWAGSIILFLLSNHYFNRFKRQQKELESEQSNSALSKLLKWKSGFSKKTQTPNSVQQSMSEESKTEKSAVEQELDPFAAIRKKDKLRSYADVVIDQKPDK
ncbi:MAG: hypothetical protein ACI97K_002395 [Glaciecola sp.]|jgi:hypothetical protein